MKLIDKRLMHNGKIQVVIEMTEDELLLPLRKGAYYKLGYPCDDIISADHFEETVRVVWLSDIQNWEPA